jgi:hypothetical protein
MCPPFRTRNAVDSTFRYGIRVPVCSVSDPDPDPQDPYVFWPPGSGSISQRYESGSESFYHQAKIVRKHLFLLFCDIFVTFKL